MSRPGPVEIHPLAPGDVAAVRALVLDIQNNEFGVPITLEDQPDLVDPAGYFRTGAGEVWVAGLDGAVVGTIALIDIGAGDGALRKMFVRADARGAEPGVAKALLDALMNHARAQGLRRIFLGTIEQFRAAHRFYEKNGFHLVAAEEVPANFPRMGDTRFYGIEL